MATSLTNTVVNAQADALARILDDGDVVVYQNGGTTPTNVDAALGGATALATLPIAATSAPAASGGVLTFTVTAMTATAGATGTAHFFRARDDGGTAVMQGLVATSGSEMNLNSTAIQSGATVTITGWTHTVPKS